MVTFGGAELERGVSAFMVLVASIGVVGCGNRESAVSVLEAPGIARSAVTGGSGFRTKPWRAQGENGAGLGAHLSSVGDVNGDGFDDLAIASPDFEPPGEDSSSDWGMVQLFFGSAAGLGSAPSQTLVGEGFADRQADVIRAGDVNGDGYADVIIQGALNAPEESGAYLHLGGPTGLNPTPAWHMPQEPGRPRVLGCAGDLNGDARSEIVVQTAEFTTHWVPSLMFFSGTPTGLAAKPFLQFEEWPLSAGGVGDFTGDGLPDVVIGGLNVVAQNVTETEVQGLFGAGGGVKADPLWHFTVAKSDFAEETERLGDVDGDGFADVGFSSYSHANFDYDGEARVYLGGVKPATVPAWEASFPENEQGWLDMAGVGDADGDGYNEMLIGLDRFFNPHNGKQGEEYPPMGRARVHFGGPSGISPASGWYAYDETLNHNSFASIAVGAGDLNGDGFADIALSDSFAAIDSSHFNQGLVYVYYGAGGAEPRGRVLWNVAAYEAGTNAVIANGARAQGASSFDLGGVGLGTMGRTFVKLEAELKPANAVLSGEGLLRGEAYVDTGTRGVQVRVAARSLESNTTYKSRLRLVYRPDTAPLTRHSRWFEGPTVTTNCDSTDPDFDADGSCDDIDLDDDNDGIEDAADCQPKNAAIAPGAPEVPGDGIDQNCSGSDAVACFADADGDGFGSKVVVWREGSCSHPGAAATGGDCDDAASGVHPGVVEVAGDGIDQDCDGKDAMSCYEDADGDGYGGRVKTVPLGACDGASLSEVGGDCRDEDASSFPGALEVVDDGLDQDCDGGDRVTCFVDHDRDGYGVAGRVSVREGCDSPGFSARSGDCNDDDGAAHPGAAEVLDDGIDQDCDGADRRGTHPDGMGGASGASSSGAPSGGGGGRSSGGSGVAGGSAVGGRHTGGAVGAESGSEVTPEGGVSGEDGCGCRVTGAAAPAGTGSAFVATLLGVFAARRRRKTARVSRTPGAAAPMDLLART